MKKKFSIFVYFIFSIFVLNTFPPDFDEFMKNVDMEQLIKDMEEILGPIDEQEPLINPQQKRINKNSKQATNKSESERKPKDKETTFKQPFKVSSGESAQTIKKLPSEKREAFLFFMNDFIKKLEELETEIDSFKYGMPFKEELEDLKLGNRKETYKNLVSNTKIQYGLIKSKQVYQRSFYLESNNELRENIIKALKKIKKLKNHKDIKQFFSITLPSISEKLTRVTDTEIMKNEIEEKIKKRKKIIQDIKRKHDRETRMARRRSRPSSHWNRSRSSTWRRNRDMPFYPNWHNPEKFGNRYNQYHPRSSGIYNTTTKPNSKNTRMDSASGKDKSDEQKGFSSNKRKSKINKIINTKKQLAEKLKTNISGKKDLLKILTKREFLSEIDKGFRTIEEYLLNLSEKEVENLKKIDTYKKTNNLLNEQLKKSIPNIIELCKFDNTGISPNEEANFNKEQKSALNIFSEVEKYSKEMNGVIQKFLSNYERRIWSEIETIAKNKNQLTNNEKNAIKPKIEMFKKEPTGKLFDSVRSTLHNYERMAA